ncbi:MAG: anaerobic carbon-monoxide dehydrogenase catalytic subunit [Planctomycetota bacterium]
MAKKEPRKPEERVADAASLEVLKRAEAEGHDTCFSRMDTQATQCGFGKQGICCKNCHMGPCRITAKAPTGVCGADADTIVARNFLREVAAGTAAHSDHGRHLVLLLKKVAEGEGGSYKIKDEKALRRIAAKYEIEEVGRTKEEVALKRQGIWQQTGVAPQGIDRMVVESLHRTHMGVDHDYRNILSHTFRTAMADGWGGARIGTQVSDILFGTPEPLTSEANLGVLGEKAVNVIVHGHEPALSDMLAIASKDPEVIEAAKAAGASDGVTLAGLCCTANEILMRHGVSVAGNFLQQELAVITGAVEMMVVDVQCVMPSLPKVSSSYHTEIISTADIAKTIGADHVSFDEENAYDCAKELLLRACENFKKRDAGKVAIPQHKEPLVAGFSVDAIKYMLGGSFRASFRPLNDAIISGRIHGLVGIVGCNNPKGKTDEYINTLTKELLKRNVLVLKTGCAAIASAKAGMLTPEAALEYTGDSLKEVCETVGIPPVLHMGSCVDNTRILEAATEVVAEGGLGDDLCTLPAVGVAPEWMSEKAVAIGCYFVASGVDVILGIPFHTSGGENVNHYLHEGATQDFGACFHHHEDPHEAVAKIMTLIDGARETLGINKKAERVMLDMADRRG